MREFDVDEPAETFDGFVASVKKLIENTYVGVDEWYPDALFTVDEYHLGRIIDIDKESEDLGIPHQFIFASKCVQHIRQDGVKWYAHVAVVTDAEDQDHIVLTAGNKVATGMWITPITYEEDEQVIHSWQLLDPSESFVNLSRTLRRAITNQG